MSEEAVKAQEDSNYIYETDYMPVTNAEIKWAIENAINSVGSLDFEPTEAYFNRVKRYAKEILLTLKQLSDEVNGSVHKDTF